MKIRKLLNTYISIFLPFAVSIIFIAAAGIFLYCVPNFNKPTIPDLEKQLKLNTEYYNLMGYLQNYTPAGKKYPDFFAGGYVTPDYSKLFIYVTDDSQEIKNIICHGSQNSIIKIVKVKYSYNELLDELNQVVAKLAQLNYRINGAGIDDKNNSISINVPKMYTNAKDVKKALSKFFDNIIVIADNGVSEQR